MLKHSFLSVLVILSFNSCVFSQNELNDKPDLPGDLSAEMIEGLEQSAGDLDNIYSYLVSYKDTLISEAYFNGKNQRSLLHVRSITKSITSLLMGIALHDELILDLDTPIIQYYPEFRENEDPLQDSISIQHILNMQAGFEWNEGIEAINWYTTIQNPTEYIFNRKVTDQPGAKWNYNSAAVHLLHRVFQEEIGLAEEKLAEDKLFDELDIEIYSWDRDPAGNVRPDAGLALTGRDLLKIGELVMDDGLIGENQVIPAEWIHTSTYAKIDLESAYGTIQNLHYNNLWWMGIYRDHEVIFGLGYGGQLLIMVPDIDLVVVTNHNFMLPGNIASQQAKTFLSTIFVPLTDHIIDSEK